MKILWLHQYFATPRGWGAVRTYEFARRFCVRGATVDVVCGAGYDASLLSTGRMVEPAAGLRVFVSGSSYRPQMGFFRRICAFLAFMAGCILFVIRRGRNYDIVIASSGPLTLAVPALVASWLWHKPFVFEVIDVWPDSAIAAGVLKNPVMKWLSLRLESLAYRFAELIVTCSTGMTRRVSQKVQGRELKDAAAERKRVLTISNCCDLDQFTPEVSQREMIRARYGVREGQTVVLYTGAMGLSNAMEDLLAAIRATALDEGIVWWAAGDGTRSQDVRKALAERGHHRHFASMPKHELVSLYLAADINVVTFMHEPLFYENSPNKFFDGIAAGLPTVFNRSTWLEPWLTRYDCGIVCKGDRPGAEMAEAVCLLAGDPERRKRMGRNARRLAEEVFDRNKLAEKYLAVLEEVLK